MRRTKSKQKLRAERVVLIEKLKIEIHKLDVFGWANYNGFVGRSQTKKEAWEERILGDRSVLRMLEKLEKK